MANHEVYNDQITIVLKILSVAYDVLHLLNIHQFKGFYLTILHLTMISVKQEEVHQADIASQHVYDN